MRHHRGCRPKCYDTETLVASFSCEIDVSRASLAGAQTASALAFGISGNTAASIAMTASRFSSNMCQVVVFKSALTNSPGQTCGLHNGCSRSAEIMGE